MNQSRVLRYVRITNSGKLSDRFVTTQVKEASDPAAKDAGRLFAIVEITTAWFPSSQIGQTLINTAAREYFKSSEADPLVRFESALKKVNETLGHVAQTADADWVAHLHAVLALQVDDQLHVSSTGGARGWLIREKKGTPLVEASQPNESPTKTFSSVLSGVLEPGDRLIFASSGLFQVLNLSEFQTNIVAADDLTASAVRLANLLRAKRGQWVNALVLDYQAAEVLANTPAHRLPDTLYLDASSVGDWRLTLTQALKHSHQGVVRLGSHLNRLNGRLNHFFKTILWPKSQRAFKASQDWSSQQLHQFQTSTVPAVKEQAARLQERLKVKPATTPAPNVNAGPPSIIGKSVFAIHDYQTTSVGPEPERSPRPETTSAGSAPVERVHHYEYSPLPTEREQLQVDTPPKHMTWPKLYVGHATITTPGGWKTLLTVAVIAALLIILIMNLSALTSRRQDSISRTQAAQRLTELQDQLEEAKLAKIFNQTEKAITAAQGVVSGAAELASSPLTEDAAEVASEAQGVIDDLTSTTRLAALEELDTTEGSALAVWGDNLSVATKQGGIETRKQTGGEAQSLSLPNNEPLAALTAFDKKTGLAVLSKAPAAYQTDSASGPLSFITPSSGGWKSGVALAPFFNNLYILSPDDNQIWKYTATEGQYSGAEEYVTDGTGLDGAVDLAIDGSVYVLKSSGEVLKLTRGKREEFRVRDVPKPTDTFPTPKQIEATGDALYVLESNRIVKLATDGRFQSQYALQNNEPIVAFAIKDTTIFILTDSRLIKTGL